MDLFASKKGLFIAGGLLGCLIALLAYAGNPANMALCSACFIRDIAGAMQLHQAAVVQYFRPEIVGILAGAFLMAVVSKEYQPKAGSAPVIRFLVGMMMMICALVFLGCTLRMLLRLAAGDLSALVGLVGFIPGVYTGTLFLKKGYKLSATPVATSKLNGAITPLFFVLLFVVSLAVPALFVASESGPGSMHANTWLALGVGLAFGALAFKTRLCFAGAVRDIILHKEFSLATPISAIFIVMLAYNLLTQHFAITASGPIAHDQFLWNFLAMYAVGLAGVLVSGCPVRQIVLAGSGNSDAAMTVFGMLIGAAFAHNFKLAAAAKTTEAAGGPGLNGQIAVVVSIIVLLGIGYYFTKHPANNQPTA